MYKTNLRLVADFHEKMGVSTPAFLARFETAEQRKAMRGILRLRKRLIREEAEEVRKELNDLLSGNSLSIVSLMKELADLLYVVYGTAVQLGCDLDDVFLQVHKDNMAKIWPDGKPRFDKDGKVVKPDGYVAPNISCGAIAYHEENLQERAGV